MRSEVKHFDATRAPAGRADDVDVRAARPLLLCAGIATLALPLCVVAALWLDVPVAGYAAGASPAVHRWASLIGQLGLSGYMLVGSACVALAAFGLGRRTRQQRAREALQILAGRAAFVFAAVAASGILVQIAKHVVGRARPKLIGTLGSMHFDVFSLKASLASFPSGHTTSIFALGVAVGLLIPRLRWACLTLAVLVGAARAVEGSHYVSDVIAGAALGSVVALWLAYVSAGRGWVFRHSAGSPGVAPRGRVWPAVSLLSRGFGTAR